MMEKREYSTQPKYRCILRIIYDPVYAYSRLRGPLVDAGFDEREIIDQIGEEPVALSDQDAIRRTLDYTFDPRHTYFTPGRFNTDREPALYTAKAAVTAELERRYHWVIDTGANPAFVVFLVHYSGVALDIRNQVAAGAMEWPDDFALCQSYATQARDQGCDGIAAPSKRDPTGSCCAIFRREAVEAGYLVREGNFTSH